MTGLSIADAEALSLGPIAANGTGALFPSGSLSQVNTDPAKLFPTHPGDAGAVGATDGTGTAIGVTGFDLAILAPLVVNGPNTLTARVLDTTSLKGFSIADPNPNSPSDIFLLDIKTTVGELVSPPLVPITLKSTDVGTLGSLADINAYLAATSVIDFTSGTGSIDITVFGFSGGGDAIPASTKSVPVTVQQAQPITPAQVSPAVDSREAALIDTRSYLANNPDVAQSGLDPGVHFATYGWKEGRSPDLLFDIQYYLIHNFDVALAGTDPLLHYAQFGWKEGRDPSASFSTSAYLAAYPDVRLAGINPLQHYLQFGVAEGRAPSGPA